MDIFILVKMDGLEIKGIEFLSEPEKYELNKEIEKYSEKIKWKTKSEFILKLAIKANSKKAEDKDTKRKRFSIQAHIKGETQAFEASVEDWDFNKAVHKIFEKLLNEIEHEFHSSEQKKTNLRLSKE
jgi:ribosome-associated translation inhibitor RaiA